MEKPRFIAEVCSNHNGSLDRAIDLIKVAAAIGCWGVKFQLFRIDQLFAPAILIHPDYQYLHDRRKWELPLEWLPILCRACRDAGVKFGCTPFYLEAVKQLKPYVDFYKVASYEAQWYPLLDAIMETDKPVIISTGLSTFEETKEMIYHLQSGGYDTGDRVSLLHCVSKYPTLPEECHLNQIARLRLELNGIAGVGWSDHSVNPGVIYRAVHRYSAQIVEFHLDLANCQGEEFSLGHCWPSRKIDSVIKVVSDGLAADGNRDYIPDYPERDFRADPVDGLRPLKSKRRNL